VKAGEPGRATYELLVGGSYSPTSVEVSYSRCAASLDPDIRRAVEMEWPAHVSQAAGEGVELTNGHLLRLVAYTGSPSSLELSLGDTTYAEFLGTNCNPARHAQVPWDQLANPLGTSALIVTRDGQLVLGLRGDSVMHYRNQVHTIGGMFESVDLVDGQVDATDSILREVQEELGVGPEGIEGATCRGLVRELLHLQPELMFEVEVKQTFAELKDYWLRAESRQEHAELISIPDRAGPIAAFLREHPSMAPQARAALELRRSL